MHLRDEELLHRVNKRYVKGCPAGFRFGVSEIVSEAEMKTALRRTLRYGRDGPGTGKRKVVVVVHDRAGEERLLRRLDKGAFGNARVVFTADTQVFASKEGRKCGLVDLLGVLGMESEGSHNAGNDAVYTLQALVRMACLRTFEPSRLGDRLVRLRGEGRGQERGDGRGDRGKMEGWFEGAERD
ncbi:hypothetical protein BDZ85DRAFT_254371 [Elsinoe ampelina]|uniref:Gfd2/YDR514C-like C-terminal domain-containing protein n=1 Tax=Elsinoe ampelina TaxID=302913 RepID=A0A6A6GPQ6_9PEZI|nr:hypothetical protein BDZ85DRAFT_254371 [Elsinoe ampelina]